MAYLALYRKYRPVDFNSVYGQEHVVTILKNAIMSGKISHAYLFCGPRGTGKTTVAKIIARLVNCENLIDGNPCGKCYNCINYMNSSDIVEIDAISALSDADQVVIACGGGGIPVLAQNNRLQGASAVIEKDLAAGKLAELLDADMLVILTGVDKVCLNYGKEDEIKLDTLSLADARKYLAEGQFEAGTMAPKIEAAIDFIGESAIRSALITKLNKDAAEITGGMGTLIKK